MNSLQPVRVTGSTSGSLTGQESLVESLYPGGHCGPGWRLGEAHRRQKLVAANRPTVAVEVPAAARELPGIPVDSPAHS